MKIAPIGLKIDHCKDVLDLKSPIDDLRVKTKNTPIDSIIGGF